MQCASPTGRNLGIRTISVDLRRDDFPIIDSSFWRTPALIVSMHEYYQFTTSAKSPRLTTMRTMTPRSHVAPVAVGLLRQGHL